MLLVLSLVPTLKQRFNELFKMEANWDQSRTCYFYNDIINIEEFDSNVLKIDKSITKGFVFTAMDTLQ